MSVQDVIDGTRRWGVAVGDCTESLRALPDGCAQCCVTSPPYYGLRSYLPAGHPDKAKEIGLEETPEAYIARMVGVFAEVKRVLRADGVLWVNIGDSYNAYNGNRGRSTSFSAATEDAMPSLPGGSGLTVKGLKNKDRIGIPHMLAFALRADGWYFRDEVIWHKPNPMPSSTTDRTTAAHEFVFMFSKSARYYYDGLAIAEPVKASSIQRADHGFKTNAKDVGTATVSVGANDRTRLNLRESFKLSETSNKRSVWRISTRPYKGSHYATYPPKLVEPCILAGTSAKGCCPACGSPWVRVVARKRVATRPGKETKVTGDTMTDGNRDPQRHVTSTETTGWAQACKCEPAEPIPCVVLDPFVGSGTTLQVANEHGRRAIGCDLDERNLKLIRGRMELVQPLIPGAAA